MERSVPSIMVVSTVVLGLGSCGLVGRNSQ